MQGSPTAIDVILTAIVLSGIALVVVCGAWYLARDFWRRRRVMSNVGGGVPGAEPEPTGASAVPHMNAVEPLPERGSSSVQLVLNADELVAVQRMIEHKMTAVKPSKSSTIQAGFGVSRGGSQLYQRASLIYDALFGEPAPAIQYRRPDGSVEPPTHPVSGRPPLRTHPR